MTKKETDYTALMSELNQLLSEMQAGDISVDEAIRKYERGQALLVELRMYLDQAENHISIHKAE